ncbi:MAG TPA: nitrogen regulation protein NR(II) [Burkholderiales bacterium]|nr:nitrogen regulation protein NR(II) [Burkholderiales bacterium]
MKPGRSLLANFLPAGAGHTDKPFRSTGLDALAAAVIYLRSDLTVLYANPAAENLFKVSGRNIVGHRLTEVFPNASLLTAAIYHAAERNCSYLQHELNLATAAQERFDVSCTVTPAEIDGVDGYLLEFNELHQQLRMAREERMHEQTEASRWLIRNLAHEIKNPLGGLRGAAQLLERELERPELTEYTQVIMKEADRLQTLMDRLLIPHGLPQLAPLNIHEAVERVRSLVLAEFPEGIRISREYDVSLPAVEADREQIIQALLNIVRNAAQALRGNGDIVLGTRVARQVTLARKLHPLGVMIQVIDNGPGVPEELRDKVFFPLVSGREGGTGLGLTLAQNLISQHHGTIELESEPGRTCFTIVLPLRAGGA